MINGNSLGRVHVQSTSYAMYLVCNSFIWCHQDCTVYTKVSFIALWAAPHQLSPHCSPFQTFVFGSVRERNMVRWMQRLRLCSHCIMIHNSDNVVGLLCRLVPGRANAAGDLIPHSGMSDSPTHFTRLSNIITHLSAISYSSPSGAREVYQAVSLALLYLWNGLVILFLAVDMAQNWSLGSISRVGVLIWL